MANQKRSSANEFTFTRLNKAVWVRESKKYNNYLLDVEKKLERATGFALNGQQLFFETRAILACIAIETDGFLGWKENQIKNAIQEFFRHYLRLRDEAKYPGIKYAETASDRFERAFVAIASQVFNYMNFNRDKTHPPDNKCYIKISEQ